MQNSITRRGFNLALGVGAASLALRGMPAFAQGKNISIGTGGTGGVYYPIGGAIVAAV